MITRFGVRSRTNCMRMQQAPRFYWSEIEIVTVWLLTPPI
jgi:hypothetical protein